MNEKRSSLGRRVVNNTTFAILDLILTKTGTVAVFILLVRILEGRDIAAIGIATGYLVQVAYLDIAPIRILLRDYPKIAGNPAKRDRLLTPLFLFWGFQALAMLLLCLGLQFLVLRRLDLPGIQFLFFALTVDFIALTFQDWIKTIFYTDFQQGRATAISCIFMTARLACYGALFFEPALDTYSWLLIATSLAGFVLWGAAFQMRFHFRPVLNGRTVSILRESLSSYGIWDHLNRMAIDTLFSIDVVILSWIALDRIEDIGSYTIALKFTSLLFLIPMQMHRSLQVVLSNSNDREKRTRAINSFIKVNFIVSVAQYLVVVFFGGLLIRLLFGGNAGPGVLQYTIIIATGVTIMNLGWPFMSIVNNLCNIARAFLIVFLPNLLFGLAFYMGAAVRWGALGMAYANIVIYTMLALGLVAFTVRQYPFPFRFELITEEERSLLRELTKGRFGSLSS